VAETTEMAETSEIWEMTDLAGEAWVAATADERGYCFGISILYSNNHQTDQHRTLESTHFNPLGDMLMNGLLCKLIE
jgi:hypothetical protein